MRKELTKMLSHVFHNDSLIYDNIEDLFEKEYKRFIDEKVAERLAETYSSARCDHEIEFDEVLDKSILSAKNSAWFEGYIQGHKDRSDGTGDNFHLNPYSLNLSGS